MLSVVQAQTDSINMHPVRRVYGMNVAAQYN
jgi:hypothetical protein